MGVGGRGCSAIEHLARGDVARGLRLLSANTDSQPLARVQSPAVHRILMGDGGHGAGGCSQQGQRAAELTSDELEEALAGSRRLLIVAGLGGGTGSGATPVVARIAHARGMEVHLAVTLPFSWEGAGRMETAYLALETLSPLTSHICVFKNDDLLALGDTVSMDDAFSHADEQIARVVCALWAPRPG